MELYKITEFAELIGKTPQTLRIWDKKGKLKPNYRDENGWRLYTEEQLKEYLRSSSTIPKKRNIVYIKDHIRYEEEKQLILIDRYCRKEKVKVDEVIYEKGKFYETSLFKAIVDEIIRGEVEYLIIIDRDVFYPSIFTIFFQLIENTDTKLMIISELI